MKKTIQVPVSCSVFVLSIIVNQVFSQTGYFGEYFRHQCRDTNQFSNYTLMSNAAVNGDPSANVIFTPFSAMGGVDENYHAGLYYNNGFSKWAIYNENTSDSISLFSTFNVLIPTANGTAIKHTSTSSNTTANLTFIDDPATNGKPDALLYITHNWGTTGGVYNNHATGVFYHQASGKWGIFNENLSAFPIGAAYNVFVVDAPNSNAFIHTTSTPSISTPYTSTLNYSSLNNNSVILVTHNFSPGGLSNNKYDTSSVGVAMKGLDWIVKNMDKVTRIDSGTTYNILIASGLPTGIESKAENNTTLTVYPNPASSILNVDYALEHSGMASLKLFDVMGRMVLELQTEARSIPLNTEQLIDGIYFLVLTTEGTTLRRQVIITK